MSPSPASCTRPLQRHPNVEKRVSLSSSPTSRDISMNSCSSSSVTSETCGSLSRGASRSDTSTPPTEESISDVKDHPPLSPRGYLGVSSTPPSTKRHAVFLSPSGQLVPSTSRANPTKPIGTTLHDPGPVSPLPSPTRPKARNNGDFAHRSSPRSAGEPPVTPVRRRTAKELIDHFERSGGSAPRTAPAMKLSATAPTGLTPRTPLSEARLNGPLPALPLKEPFAQYWQPSSPSRSPIRSLMNMVGLGKKGKHSDGDAGWKGRRKGSVSPTLPPRRARALLAEDDETPIPLRRSFERETGYELGSRGSNEDRIDAVTMKTISDDHATPVRDIPIFLREKPGDEENPILRAGPLLYLISSKPETWCNTQAVLQTPTLTLSDPQPPPTSEQGPSTISTFRSFPLRYCAVESLPCTILDGLSASSLGLYTPSPLIIGPRDIALYVFEISFPESSPGNAGKKERFATTGAWDRGNYNYRDAICAANVFAKPNQGSLPTPGILPSEEAKSDECDANESDTDLCTRRLQPPLRVVNASKLSAFYDIDTVRSTKGIRLSSDESGRLLSTEVLSNNISPSAITPNRASMATSTTNPPPTFSNVNVPLRSAPLQKPPPYNTPQTTADKDETHRKDRGMKTRSRSVPCSPSVNDLGKMTLVQRRLARFESTKEDSATYSTDMETRGRSLRPPSIRPGASPPSRAMVSNMGLSTPPISPNKATAEQRRTPSNQRAGVPTPFGKLPARTIPQAISSANDPKLPPSPGIGSTVAEPMSSRRIARSVLEPRTEHGGLTSFSGLGGAEQRHCGDSAIQMIDDPAPLPPEVSRTRRQSTATMSTVSADRLSGLTSIPGSEYPDIAPLFSLVRDTALEQVAQVKALKAELEALKTEIQRAPVEPLAVKGKEMTLHAIGRGERSEKTEELASTLDSMQAQLSSITTDLKNLAPSHQTAESSELATELRETLPRHSQHLADIRNKLEQVDAMKTTLMAMNEASCADRASWTQKLDGIAGGIDALKLDGVHDRLDGIRASLAVLEAVAQSQQVASASISPISAFRNSSRTSASDSNAPIDLAPLQEKLDALAQKEYGPTDEVINGLRDQVQSLSELCKKIMAKAEHESPDEVDDVPPGGEKPQEPQIPKLLEHLKEDRTNQEKYFTDLNSWLQANATQTSSQYHTISAALQEVTQALAPLAADAAPSDTPNVPGSDAELRQMKGNVFQEIRQALLENNSRNRANDNFLAAANHLIGAANAERQNLTALIASQREENERLLSHFASQITSEIRGQKHSFVDAMEKATALNVEGQLRELKTQISSQLVEMARGVERLSEERKVLEQQIAELLAFKSRFTPPDYSDMPSIVPGEYMPQVVPRSSRQRLRAEPTGQAQGPHHSMNLQQRSSGRSRSPSPAPGSKRPLPSPNQLHPMHNQAPQMGQRF
ncbi:hypothetical protein FRC05_008386 [Tulasnella sp. 425]|nr:hypothetical protein FRC05_008386 [Tulasnella sp. 425]